ncbi:MAG TPA: hypothetical protein VK722_03835 [Candidatus Aquilonibacter sp.]|nr:hypothetical protein [Candidatus Aquilonibacter sp.]
MCKLLRYLAEHALDHPGAALKEYQIAVEVLGRSGGFDPQSDSTVRVQAGRLRFKLEEYYSHEGPDDAVIVELPKGSYTLVFHVRTPTPKLATAAPLTKLPEPKPANHSNHGLAIAVMVLSVLLAGTLLLLANRARTQANLRETPPVYKLFWSRFISGPQQPWVIFSNGSFVGRPETGMRYFNTSADSGAMILDHYTGVGEVLAVHELDRLFVLVNQQLRVKRGSLFSLDDAKNNDLIFVGSPAENLTLLDIPGTQEFVFQRVGSGPRKGDLAVLNMHPQPGEPQMFLGSVPTQPTTEDYAVIALVPGIDPARSVLILAGTTTFGTQAAAEYVCRPDSLAELLRQLGVSKVGELKPFEALLHVKVAHGVPVITNLVAVRKRAG